MCSRGGGGAEGEAQTPLLLSVSHSAALSAQDLFSVSYFHLIWLSLGFIHRNVISVKVEMCPFF